MPKISWVFYRMRKAAKSKVRSLFSSKETNSPKAIFIKQIIERKYKRFRNSYSLVKGDSLVIARMRKALIRTQMPVKEKNRLMKMVMKMLKAHKKAALYRIH